METTINRYIKYVEDRLRSPKAYCFEGEHAVRKSIASYNASGSFFLLQLYADDCCLYECETNDDGSKFRIRSCDIYNHELGAVLDNHRANGTLEKYSLAYFIQDGKYTYDEYYDTLSPKLAEHNRALQQALCELPNRWTDASLYIDGDYSEFPSVVYALQRNASKVVSMKLTKPSSQGNPNALRCMFPNMIKEQIKTSDQISFIDCLKQPKAVFIPLKEESLDSVFYREIKWRHILPNVSKDCEIAGVDCKCIELKTEVDGFQNVFCRATDAYGKSKSVLVFNALNMSVEVKDEAIAVEVTSEGNEQKQNIEADIHIVESSNDKEGRSEDVEEENGTNEEETSTHTNLPFNAKGKRYSELIEEIDIMSGDTGHSYSTLFGKYLNGASTVVLVEPYIVYPHQWNNLKEFIALLIEVGRVKSFRLITQEPELVKLPDHMERLRFISDFNAKLVSIKNEIGCSHVDFSWKLSSIIKDGWTLMTIILTWTMDWICTKNQKRVPFYPLFKF